MMSAEPFTSSIRAMAPKSLVEAVERAAAAKLTTPSEYTRQAVLAALNADGIVPGVRANLAPAQWALVCDGELVVGPHGCPITTVDPTAPVQTANAAANERGEWWPIANEDTDPFDAARHYRLTPLPLRVDGARVVRTFQIVERA